MRELRGPEERDGLTRRELLAAGAAGTLALSLGSLLPSGAARAQGGEDRPPVVIAGDGPQVELGQEATSRLGRLHGIDHRPRESRQHLGHDRHLLTYPGVLPAQEFGQAIFWWKSIVKRFVLWKILNNWRAVWMQKPRCLSSYNEAKGRSF